MRKFQLISTFKTVTRDHISIFIFVLSLFVVGVMFGAVIVNSLGLEQKQDLFEYLTKFFNEFGGSSSSPTGGLLLSTFFENIKIVLLIWILGISVIGVPLTLILLFSKGVVIGFTVGFLVNQSGFKGFLLACASVLPQNLIFIPFIILLTSLSIIFSIKLIKRQFLKDREEKLKSLFLIYIGVLFIGSFVLLATSIIEIYMSPILMKWIILHVL
ncbi:MAG: spoIIM [Bacillales bacterium]|jgi:stage II sporulation protein M|nr:spoIIM [Bacillales bacterium]